MKDLLAAAVFAAEKHSTQRRKDPAQTPYINHPIAVAEILIRIGGVSDEAVLMAAVLHDTIEDTDTTADEIRERFGDVVTGYVVECTDDKTLPKAERKRLQIVNASHKSPQAAQIKVADKSHNLRSIFDHPPEGWERARILDYFQWAEKVVGGLKGHNDALDQHVREVIDQGLKAFG